MLKQVLRSFALLASVSLCSSAVWASGFEVSGFGGAITMDGGVGTHATYGGGAAFLLGDNVHIFGEFSTATLATTSVSSGSVTATGSAKLANYGGGVDYSFGSADSKFRPYVLAGLGVGHYYATGSGGGTSVSLGITNEISYSFGGGVRVYLGKHWGLKPEVRYQRYGSANAALIGATVPGANTVQYTGGIFYQFGH
jgi:outer membrane protein W